MNAEISSNDDNAGTMDEPIIESGDLYTNKEKLACNNGLPAGCPPEELDPKNYKYLPSCWTAKIRAAGKQTNKTQSLQGILC